VASSLLLVSTSPRRQKLLTEAGFEFESVSPTVDEKVHVDLTLLEVTAFNATRKAMSVAREHPTKVVLAADTLVALDQRVIGKPKNIAEATAILRSLSGRTHEVCTSVFICQLFSAKSKSFQEISRVHFLKLSEAAIRAYIDKINPLDKAGAYAAQGEGAEIIEKIDGSYTNVVGLPMEKTVAALAEFGIHPLRL
jgi:septum formation protein